MSSWPSSSRPRFDIDTGNVANANPARNRPDMYVDQRKFTTPLYDAIHKGSLPDLTPFMFPKFNSASGLVADHVEGVEPTPGAFDMTSQTVTPSAMSGKVEITREVWDQGGNPQVSGLIWNKMVYAYYQALETKAVAILDAATPTAIPLTAGAADDDLVNELESAIAGLQFVAGGNTFNFGAAQQDLYKKLAAAVDSTGRKLLPDHQPHQRQRAGQLALPLAGRGRHRVRTGVVARTLGLRGRVELPVRHLVRPPLEHGATAPGVPVPRGLRRPGHLGLRGRSDLGPRGVREITYDPVA